MDRSILLSTRPAPTERTCEVVDTPLVLPAADALVDSARLAEDVRALWRGQELAPGYALLSLEWDENGYNSRRVVFEHDLQEAAADSLQELVFQHRRSAPEGDPWGVRLRIDVGDDVAFRVGRQEYCPPKVRYSGTVTGELLRAGYRRNPSGRLRTHRVTADVRVSATGVPEEIRLSLGVLDSRYRPYLREYILSSRFEPAIRDGIPVEGWVRMPMTLRTP